MAPIEEVQLYERDAGGNRVNVSFRNSSIGKWAPRSPAPISSSARPATASCSSRRDRMAPSECSFPTAVAKTEFAPVGAAWFAPTATPKAIQVGSVQTSRAT